MTVVRTGGKRSEKFEEEQETYLEYELYDCLSTNIFYMYRNNSGEPEFGQICEWMMDEAQRYIEQDPELDKWWDEKKKDFMLKYTTMLHRSDQNKMNEEVIAHGQNIFDNNVIKKNREFFSTILDKETLKALPEPEYVKVGKLNKTVKKKPEKKKRSRICRFKKRDQRRKKDEKKDNGSFADRDHGSVYRDRVF